jgi:EpsD family peptidyl-prolyl cis-trans isomerase
MKYTMNCMILLVPLLLSGCGSNDIAKSTQVMARVGDREITTTYFDRQLGNLPDSVQRASSQGQGKKAVLEALVNKELLYAEALKRKVDKGADLQKRFDDMKKELIISTYLQNEMTGKITVDDKEIEGFYNSHSGEFRNRQEVRISQIVVPDMDKAGEIIKKLELRRDFGELAQVHSTDKVSAARKGDVGWFSFTNLPEAVRDSVFKLPVGGVGKPFKREDSYEIYKITDRRSVSYSLEQAKEAIRVQIYNDKTQKELTTLLDGIKKTTRVQMNEALLK